MWKREVEGRVLGEVRRSGGGVEVDEASPRSPSSLFSLVSSDVIFLISFLSRFPILPFPSK
jgi:hypothetical protein